MIDKKSVAKTMLLGAFVLAMIVALAFDSHCMPARHDNNIGAVIADDNTNIYLIGLPVDGKVFECRKNAICTNITFRPYNTDLLHTESILFCGNEVTSFAGKTGVLALAYRRQGSYANGGVACHDLISVFEVKAAATEVPLP